MSNINHTPGPWHVGGNGTIIYDASNEGWAIANAYHGRHPLHSAEANARLMASSPDLLEALQEILDLECDDEGNRVIPRGFLYRARDAIAKATAEPSLAAYSPATQAKALDKLAADIDASEDEEAEKFDGLS